MKFLPALVALCFTFAAHAGVKIEHWIAPSGARVFFVETHALPILDVAVDFAAGAALDPSQKSGLADLTRGLLNSGAGEMNEEQIAGRFVDLGARFGASGDMDRAGVSLRTLTSEREGALDLLHLILAQPRFPQEALAREKSRAAAAIQEEDTHPDAIAAKRFTAAIYPGHPYGVHPTVESVAAIQRDDVENFYRAYFSARRSTVSIVGDVTRAQAEALAQKLTADLPPGEPLQDLPPIQLPASAVIKAPHPAAQSQIHLGLPAVRRGDPDYFALLTGNYTLGGGGFVSRLMKEVREKRGYAYSVYSYVAPKKLEGPFEIGLQTRRDQTEAALKVVREVFAAFVKDGPTAQELAAAKKHLIDSLALNLDSNAKLMNYVKVIGFYGLPLTYLDDFPARINAVTQEAVRAAFARRIKPENLMTVIVAGE